MKKISIASCLVLISLMLVSFYIPTYLKTKNDKIEVFFDKTFEFEDLAKTKNDLLKDDIVLNFQLLAFDNKGKLTAIGFNVISEGKYCGGGKTDDLTSKYGFIIDKNPSAAYYFQVGLRKK